jgi:signal transduction histidine kinase
LTGRMDKDEQQFMTFITEAAGNMEHLIESLLRYAESTDELTTARVSVGPLIDRVMRQLEPLMREAGATITTGPLPEINADPVRLQQVFQNLIVNAINYSAGEPPRIHISASVTDEGHQFAVADNGIGIPRECFERIFAPLKRLHSNKTPGSGIGLALCRRIVERHGGRIWVESEPQKGSTFFFTLPIIPAPVLR